MNTFFFIAMLIAMGLTLATLIAGIITMGKGNKANDKYGNKFMKARVMMQGVALVCFAGFILTST